MDHYLWDAQISDTDFGKAVGVSQITVSRWLKGQRRPTVENAKAIEKATLGRVRAAAFFPELNGG